MAQKLNLNVNPYYDDYDKNNNFYKVLFKPGYPVQARELTTLQSILQNQIESFGSHVFKEGSMVIPGSITYDDNYFSVIVNPSHLGTEISLYLSELVGKKIQGENQLAGKPNDGGPSKMNMSKEKKFNGAPVEEKVNLGGLVKSTKGGTVGSVLAKMANSRF